MFRFIETIRLENGKFGDLSYHEARMNRAVSAVLRLNRSVNLEAILASHKMPETGLHKVRIVYGQVVHAVEAAPYSVREIKTLKIVHSNSMEYSHKFEDRTELKKLFETKENCDDIVIVKDNSITDSFYANLVFKKDGQWFTPKSYLLNGTMRQHLLDQKIILEADISTDDLIRYEKVKLINAMLLFDAPEIDVSQIVK